MIELNKIYNEDCLEGMKRIPDGSVDCVIRDLPYGIDEEGIFYHYGHHIFNEERMLSEDILATDWEEV